MSKEEMPEVLEFRRAINNLPDSTEHWVAETVANFEDLYRALQAENEALKELVKRVVKGKDYYGEPCLEDFENDPLSWFHERDNLLESRE